MLLQSKGYQTLRFTQTQRNNALHLMDQAFLQMMSISPAHPATLQAAMVLQDIPESKYNIRLPRAMQAGYNHALERLEDPTAAIQHLLFCMYFELQVQLQNLMSVGTPCVKPGISQQMRLR